MSWFNYHTHCNYCDGKYPAEEYVLAAINKGFFSLGFSSHFPLPFSAKFAMAEERLADYLAQIESLCNKYACKIDIYTGAEVDYIPEQRTVKDAAVQAAELDYTIGSIHFVDSFFDGTPWQVDGRHLEFLRGLKDIFHYDIQQAVRRYYALTREMIKQTQPTIIGHLDKIKVQNWDNQFFDERERWYHNEVMATLETIQKYGGILEVNTRGIYKRKALTTFPSPWILEIALDLDIPVTLSCDAHHPDELKLEFKKTAAMLRDLGYQTLQVLSNGAWVEAEFDSLGIKGQQHFTSSRIVA
mgnify:CR=1 FL=1